MRVCTNFIHLQCSYVEQYPLEKVNGIVKKIKTSKYNKLLGSRITLKVVQIIVTE